MENSTHLQNLLILGWDVQSLTPLISVSPLFSVATFLLWCQDHW